MPDPILDRLLKDIAPNEREHELEVLTGYAMQVLGVSCVPSHPCNQLFCPKCLRRHYSRLYEAISQCQEKYLYIRNTDECPIDQEFPEAEFKRFSQRGKDVGLKCVGWISAPGVLSSQEFGGPTAYECSRVFVGVWARATKLSQKETDRLVAVKKPNKRNGNRPEGEFFIELAGPFNRREALERIIGWAGNSPEDVVQVLIENAGTIEYQAKFRSSF